MTINTLIHLGAGPCQELEAHLALDPKRLILVEADPRQAEKLTALIQDDDHVSVRNLAIAATSGSVTFHRYNLPDAGSLHQATRLQALFPGLRFQQTLTMEAQDPCAFVDSLELNPDAEHLLIVDLPGEELAVLQALHEGSRLHGFRHLQLHCGHEPLYASGEGAGAILDWLSGQGFDVVACDESRDPDRPCWTLRLNPLKLDCLRFQERIQTLELDKHALVEARDEQARLAAERQQQIETLTAEKDALAKSKATLTTARDEQMKLAAESQQRIEALTAEKDAFAKDKAALTTACDEQARLAAERQQRLEELTAEKDALAKNEAAFTIARDEQAKLAAERQQRIEALSAEKAALAQEKTALASARDEQAKLAVNAKAEAEKQAKLAAERADQLAQRDEAYSALRRDNALALRIQMLRESDLRDLQQRYAEVIEKKDKQEILLKQLTERLTLASSYLNQLEHHSNGNARTPEELTERTAKDTEFAPSLEPQQPSQSQAGCSEWPLGKLP
ncbi:hypothetical protein [Thiorhodococcus drewsii]|nr:hypothetical protein [Thiorhodococcus drewsii]